MMTVRETITSGIQSVAQLQAALQTAIQLEFSTIPPYLCAEWSINNDPSNVAPMIHDIVIQEMLHFAFSCNMLNAIGGSPSIANAAFVPNYPTLGLPGNVQPGLVVDLLPLGPQALNTFMEIEYPETGMVAPDPDSIGAFYDTISAAFTTLNPPISASATQVVTNVGGDQLTAIKTVTDAVNAINLIKGQGEGASGTSPFEGPPDTTELAHYYAFAQIYFGNQLVQVGNQFQYTGPQIQMPTVFSFQTSTGQPSVQSQFSQTFTSLLTQLEACWTSGASIGTAIGTMFTLQGLGQTLIQAGVRPPFLFVGAAAKASA